ncbi:hypothetical protein MSMTP_0462 [Methanosarcina sp. MTP4]|nr:hypothetical protein MSMTP_0462 [Methanosarcina sp. MTP4]
MFFQFFEQVFSTKVKNNQYKNRGDCTKYSESFIFDNALFQRAHHKKYKDIEHILYNVGWSSSVKTSLLQRTINGRALETRKIKTKKQKTHTEITPRKPITDIFEKLENCLGRKKYG